MSNRCLQWSARSVAICILFMGIFAKEVSAQMSVSKGTFAIQTVSKRITGTPLVWDDHKVFLLTAYGKFEQIEFKDVKGFTKKSDLKFVFSKSSFEKKLKAEFGDRYQISITQDYLVVHPMGQGDYWPKKIQETYNSFRAYFESRQIPIAKKTYPFVAIVFGSRSEFDQYAKRNNEYLGRQVVGYYSINSNRVMMYDRSASREASQNFETIVHEIAHQSAFNCGIHSRFGDTPRWVAEGLGTMFEAKGVWNSLRYPQESDRINKELYQNFQQNILNKRRSGWVGDLVVGNRLFDKKPGEAYSSAWALTFFLMETKPHAYVSYMKRLNKLKPFQPYSPERRLQDFNTAFGGTSAVEGTIINFFRRFD